TAITPGPPLFVQPPPSAPAIPERVAVAPADDRPEDGPIETAPGSPDGRGDQPAVPDTELSPGGPAPSGPLGVGTLDLRATLAGVQSAGTSLPDGLRDGRWQFPDETRLRAFLARVVLCRLYDRGRTALLQPAREEPLAGVGPSLPGPEPRPSEQVRAADAWEA